MTEPDDLFSTPGPPAFGSGASIAPGFDAAGSDAPAVASPSPASPSPAPRYQGLPARLPPTLKPFNASSDSFNGLLCIGDPHLCSRVPGFRRDDYPRVALDKLRGSLALARDQNLLPVILGDLFHFPRDNANWLTVELIRLFEEQTVLVIAGNHDMNENTLSDHDTLAVLLAAGRLRCVDGRPWVGRINDQLVAVGGTNWGQTIPGSIDRVELGNPRWVVWLTHHDVNLPGAVGFGGIYPHEIAGVDLVINGHIHRQRDDIVCGSTTWLNPGNICRVARDDATRSHTPSVLKISFSPIDWRAERIVLPHAPFEEVFHAEIIGDAVVVGQSFFVAGLSALQSFKTGGEGLRQFVRGNLEQFADARVRDQLLVLMEEVLSDAGKN